VALEVRIFPILDASGQIEPALGPALLDLQAKDIGVGVCSVEPPNHEAPNAALVLRNKACVVDA
jgi:hypothetical protein